MALNIKNDEVERLVRQLSAATGQSKTETVRVALEEQRAKVIHGRRRQKIQGFMTYLEDEVWSRIPEGVLGVPISKEEREEILGYGPEGV